MNWRLAKMDSELFKLMATQGAFAILFSYLLL